MGGQLCVLCRTSGRHWDSTHIVYVTDSFSVKLGEELQIFMNYKDFSNPENSSESPWRHTSWTVSANIIFVHAQKFPVTVRSLKLLFPHTASHSSRRLALSDASHPQSNRRLERDQIVVWLYGFPSRDQRSLCLCSCFFLFDFTSISPFSAATAMILPWCLSCCVTRYGVGVSYTYRVKTCRMKPLLCSLEVFGLFCLQMHTNRRLFISNFSVCSLVCVLLTRPCPPRNTSVSAPDFACPA